MKGFLTRLKPALRTALANESTEEQELIGLENEFSIGADGWVKIAPYGQSIKERIARGADGKEKQEAFLQVLDKGAAEEMARKFNSPWGKLKRFIRGVPIFKQHPDLSTHAPETVDDSLGLANEKVPVGMFAGLEARDDGFYGRAIVTDDGATAIENEGLKWLSPFWWVRGMGERNGVRIVRPVELISAGLTRRPNIRGGDALANQKEETHMNKTKLLAALNAIGLTLANEATDEQIETAIGGLVPQGKVTALENEKTTLATQKGAVEALGATEKTAREKAEKDLGETKTALANERKARIILVIDNAVLEGRVTPAEKAKRTSDLEAASTAGTLDAAITALSNEAPKFNTRARTQDLGNRKSELDKSSGAQEQVIALCNERMAATKCSWDAAWKAIKREKPELFEVLKGQAA